MSFQSYGFLFLFLPLAIWGWHLCNRRGFGKIGQLFLLGCSLFFYGYHRLFCLPLLLLSIVGNYLLGQGLLRWQKYRRPLLWGGLLLNLGLLAYFKYVNFFIDNWNALFHTDIASLSVLLPLGISFFTFQQLAFLLDLYHGEKSDASFLEYALYVSFFPTVTSGPIAYHNEVIPQLRRVCGRGVTAEQLSAGLVSFSLGLFKKVLLAEAFGGAASWGFEAVGSINSTTALLVVLSYTFQLYFDFSGYSDMARGIGQMLGISLPQNFNAPYRALTIGGFWKGWHMTMTRFFTRYLYIPLGGNRKGQARTCLNILIIFLVSGLWHGANWTFVIWGGLHGLAMVLERLLGRRVERLHPVLSWGITFSFVNFCWVFFRAESLSGAVAMCKAVARCDFGSIAPVLTTFFQFPSLAWLGRVFSIDPTRVSLFTCLLFFGIAFIVCLQGKTETELLGTGSPKKRVAVLCAVLLFWAVISMSGVTQFLYSNF